MRLVLLLLLLLAAPALAQTAPGPEGPPAGRWREQLHWLPVGDALIQARLCRPEARGAATLVVINHGSPANAARRAGMAPWQCTSQAAQWFLARGQAVMFPLRRGYGPSGGGWAEAYGACQDADFARGGRETARDIAAAIAYATRLPEIRPEGVIVVGHSAGGWGALALAAQNPPQVGAVVNIAGGRGGWAQGVAHTNCRPDRLVSGAAEYGRAARVPTLWVYTANDTFFSPELAQRMHAAFTGAGGRAELRALGPWRNDGHDLFGSGGSDVWGPVLGAWLPAPR